MFDLGEKFSQLCIRELTKFKARRLLGMSIALGSLLLVSGCFGTRLANQGKPTIISSANTNQLYFENHQIPSESTEIAQNSVFLPTKEISSSSFPYHVKPTSYFQLKHYLQRNTLPPKELIRIEELVNYIPFDYPEPEPGKPFGLKVEISNAPWKPEHRLVKISIKARNKNKYRRPTHLFVAPQFTEKQLEADGKKQIRFLNTAIKKVRRNFIPGDKVTLINPFDPISSITYNHPGTDSELATRLRLFWDELNRANRRDMDFRGGLDAAYFYSKAHYSSDANNKVLVLVDSTHDQDILEKEFLAKKEKEWSEQGFDTNVISVLSGGAQADFHIPFKRAQYNFLGSADLTKELVKEQFMGELDIVAEHVKIDLKFNPLLIESYNLIGYDNQKSITKFSKKFRYSKIPLRKVKSGKGITAFYELIPTKRLNERYPADQDGEIFQLRFSYKEPSQMRSELLVFPVFDKVKKFESASPDFRFGAAVIAFGKAIKNPKFLDQFSVNDMLELANGALGTDYQRECRLEFIAFIEQAGELDDFQGASDPAPVLVRDQGIPSREKEIQTPQKL